MKPCFPVVEVTRNEDTQYLLPPPPPPTPHCTDTLTSDLLFQTEDHRHSLMQHQQLCLWLFTLQMQLTHVAQLLKGLINVTHTQALSGVVGHPPVTLALGLLLWAQILILMDTSG